MKIAIIGITGVVGNVMLKLLEKRKFPLTNLIPVASEKSVGSKIIFNGKEHEIISLSDAVNLKPDIALFSAGGSTSQEWAPKFAKQRIPKTVKNNITSTNSFSCFLRFWGLP